MKYKILIILAITIILLNLAGCEKKEEIKKEQEKIENQEDLTKINNNIGESDIDLDSLQEVENNIKYIEDI